jgi:VWFA-related protein
MRTLLVSGARIPFRLASLALMSAAWALAQAPDTKPSQNPLPNAPAPPAVSEPQQPVATIKVSTRLVTLEVVARDKNGNPVSGLTAKDFEVSEQVPPKREHRPQTISAVQFVSLPGISSGAQSKPQLPPGVYSNIVAAQQMPVPPTVLLMDGLNTNITTQLQARQQMVHMLSSVPTDVPMAIFLMDRQLHLVQGLTTDPKLLLAATAKMVSNNAPEPEMNPRDDPDSLSASMDDIPADRMPPGAMAAMQAFEREAYSATMDIRVRETLDSLRAIARYLAGYPGRKNLLWVSSSFPLTIGPDPDDKFVGMRMYQSQMDEVARALADAKVAVYPMDPAGVEVSNYFKASSRPRKVGTAGSMNASLNREDNDRFNRESTMQQVADQTGGRICVNNNDLAQCVKRAINDGTSYYELGYYPDSTEWRGEFHQITVKTKQSGVHLSYRAGYYAGSDGPPQDFGKDAGQEDPALQRAACQDVLISTAIILVAKALPADQPGQAKYFLVINARSVAFQPTEGGGQSLRLAVSTCSFDKTGKPLQYVQRNIAAKFTSQQYDAIMARHGLTQAVILDSKPEMTRVRLLVRDFTSGLLGSVEVPYSGPAKASPSLPAPALPASPVPNPSPTPSLPPASPSH